MSDETNRSSGSTRSSVVSILQPPHSSPAAGGNIKHSSDCDDATTIGSFGEEEEPEKDWRPFLSQRMVDRVRRFISRLAARTQDLKKIRPDSPSSLDSYVSKSATSNAAQETENDDKKGEHVERSDEEIPDSNPFRIFKSQMSSRLSKFTASVNVLKKGLQAIDPNSKAYLVWLFLVSMAFLYNCMATVLRGTFTACPIYSCSVNSNVVPFCPSDPVPWLPSTPDPSDPLRVNATFRQPPENSSTPLPILKSSSSSVPLGGGPALPTSTPRSRDLSPVDRPAFTIYSASHLSDYSLRFCRAMFCKSADGSGDVPTNNSTGNDSRLDYFITPRLGSASTPAEAGVTIVPSTTNIFTITGNWSAAESSRSVLYNTTSDSTSFNSSESSFTDLWKTTTPNLTTGVVDSDQKPDFTAVGTQGKKCVVIGCFPGYETERNRHLWWTIDYLCDFVYALDVLLVKTRVVFLKNGLTEVNIRETAKHYVYGSTFKLDVISILPTDLFYLIPALNFNSLVRLNRLLKIRTFWEFYERLDQTVSSGYIVRVAKTMTYMLYLIHVEACVYFEVCKYIGVGTDGWVWGGKTLPYIHCMYLSTKTAASIGNNWSPTIQEEYLFMTVYWLIGLFIFAILIGQIRDIFRSSSVNREKYRMAIDQTMFYLKSLGVSPELQGRVLMWFNFNWLNSKTLDENALLDPLPRKMRTDLAIHVHLSTLSKVKLFQDCEKSLLYDLVLKLKPVLFLPGDYICKKGEVGTEMYIVKMGIIEVVGGPNNSIVFATLREGSVFGEISLMALSGGNRRTADVRSKGYSQLFLLSKADFEEAMSDYPEAYKMLKRKSKKLLSQNKKTDDKPKEEPQEPPPEDNGPKLYQTVLKVVETNQDHQNKWPVLSFQAWTSNSNQSYVRRSFQDFIPTAMEKNRDRQKKSNSKKKQNIKMKRDESHSSPIAFNDRREEIEITQLDSSATGSVYSINESSVDASGEAVHQSRRNYRKKKRNSPQNDVVDRISLGESDPAVKFDSKTVIPGQTSQDGEIVFLNHVDIAKTVPKTILKRGKSSIGIMTTKHSREQILGCVEESRPASDSKPTSIGSTSYLAYLYSKIHLRNKPKQPDLNERV